MAPFVGGDHESDAGNRKLNKGRSRKSTSGGNAAGGGSVSGKRRNAGEPQKEGRAATGLRVRGANTDCSSAPPTRARSEWSPRRARARSKSGKQRICAQCTGTSPSAMPIPMPQAGLRAHERHSPGGSPSRVETQWPCDPPQLVYRCGGSAGFALHHGKSAPASRFIPRADAVGTPEAWQMISGDVNASQDDVCVHHLWHSG